MINVKEAKKKAQEYIEDTDLKIGDCMDDGEYFIFGFTEEVDFSPIGVNKKTGEVIDYFPPDHPKFIDAIEIE